MIMNKYIIKQYQIIDKEKTSTTLEINLSTAQYIHYF